MDASDIIRLPDLREKVRATVREVVRDIDGKAHVLWRLTLTGWHFVERNNRPFILVGDEVLSLFVVITADGIAHGYFDEPLPSAKHVSFGYGRTVLLDFDLAVDPAVQRLDRRRLPRGVVDRFASR